MLYAVRKLHLATGEVLSMHTVEVIAGVVRSYFPFDGERQSMLWVEEALLSHICCAAVLGDIKKEVAQSSCCDQPLFLYSCDVPLCEGYVNSSPLTRLG